MTDIKLYKVPFPIIDSDYTATYHFYNKVKNWFDSNGYEYSIQYKFEWNNTGRYIPDYIWCDSELAVLLKLKFGI